MGLRKKIFCLLNLFRVLEMKMGNQQILFCRKNPISWVVFVSFGHTRGPDDSNSLMPCEPRHWCTGNRTAAVETRKSVSELVFLIWHLGGICLWLQVLCEVQRSKHSDRSLVDLQWSIGSWHEWCCLQPLPEHLLNEKGLFECFRIFLPHVVPHLNGLLNYKDFSTNN